MKKAPQFALRVFFNMARLEGFEPPTAWFVARYSIQLSYRRVVLMAEIKAVNYAESWPESQWKLQKN